MAENSHGNLLLDSLGSDLYGSLNAREEKHAVAEVLLKQDEIPQVVFFPHRGAVVSIIRSTEDGSMVEAGVVGNEGAFSIHSVITDPAPASGEAMVQIEGTITRVDLRLLRPAFKTNALLRERILAYTSNFIEQITQNLVCNRLHAIEPRLAKWLLLVRERVDTDELHLTHDFLSHMLGIHRPGVSIAVTALEQQGLIKHSRNRITIRDSDGLQQRSCECFGVLHANLSKFRGSLANRTSMAE